MDRNVCVYIYIYTHTPTHTKTRNGILFIHKREQNNAIFSNTDGPKDCHMKRNRSDKIFGWHHQLDGQEFEQALGVMMGRETWRAVLHGVTKSHTTEWMNWTEVRQRQIYNVTHIRHLILKSDTDWLIYERDSQISKANLWLSKEKSDGEG